MEEENRDHCLEQSIEHQTPVVLPGIQHLCDPWSRLPVIQPLDYARSTPLPSGPAMPQHVDNSRDPTLSPAVEHSNHSGSRSQTLPLSLDRPMRTPFWDQAGTVSLDSFGGMPHQHTTPGGVTPPEDTHTQV